MEIISPYVFPILKLSTLSKKKYPYLNDKYLGISIDDVLEEICKEFEIGRDEFFANKCRKHKFVEPRKLYSYIRVFEMGAKKVDVAEEFKTDHSTIIHACRTYENLFKTNSLYRKRCEKVLRRLGLINN